MGVRIISHVVDVVLINLCRLGVWWAVIAVFSVGALGRSGLVRFNMGMWALTCAF